jgi:hypothetical protein
VSQQQQKTKHILTPHDLATIIGLFMQFIRTRNDPQAFEQTIEKITHESKMPPQDIPVVHNTFIALRDASKDQRFYSVTDRYLVAGIGAVDLVLLPILLLSGTTDTELIIALLSLVFSLPLTAMSLFFSFVKQQFKIPTYGRIHGNLSFFSLLTGTISLTATFWHVSHVAGIVFLCLAIVMYLWAVMYLVLLHVAKRFVELQQPINEEQKEP